MYNVKDVHQASKKWETYKVQLKGLVRSIDGPRLDFDPIGVGSCAPIVHWSVFWCLEWKNITIIEDFLQWANQPPRALKDLNTPEWRGLRGKNIPIRLFLAKPSYWTETFISTTALVTRPWLRYVQIVNVIAIHGMFWMHAGG